LTRASDDGKDPLGMGKVEARLLGPLDVTVDGERVPVAGPRQRALLAMLALHANQVVSVGALVDAVWGEPAPDRADHTLQQHISALRKLLGASVLSTRSPGYILHVDALDADEFEHATAQGFDAVAATRWDDALASFDAALRCWRGSALADARDSERLEAAAVRLDEQRLAASEMHCEARLECGQLREVVPELEHLVAEHPLRERPRALLMLALYRSGRQADALAAYQDARRVLVEELGIQPGTELRNLEQAILEQRPDLDSPSAGRRSEIYATIRSDARITACRIELPDGQAVLIHEGITLIGRDPAAQVHLVDNRVSRHHAEIETGSGGCTLRDLASTNGTTLNGAPVTEARLTDTDLIGIGGVELRFHGIGV
jgi:DNA-binding SARP family transcriptional activator